MKGFYSRLGEFLRSGGPIALATVVESRGSTPREVGAKMIVRQMGPSLGTVGGGCGEAQVWQDALRVLAERKPRFSIVDLTGEIGQDTPTNCGGLMDVFIDFWEAGCGPGAAPEQIVESALEALNKGEKIALATVMAGPLAPGLKIIFSADGSALGWDGDQNQIALLREAALSVLRGNQSRRLKLKAADAELDVFFELIIPPPELVIVGAGHIAVPLCHIAKTLNFEVTIIDDRASFANQARFPEADRIIVGPIEESLERLQFGPSTHIVLVTRGHQMDQAALMRVAGRPAQYIGMIGSKRRVEAVFDYLLENGIAADLLQKVYAPIGLDIGAETPEEIALAIMAEIVKVNRGGRAASLSEGRKRPRQYRVCKS
jgi:xanthine dehydrogenase accessory factor